MAATNEARIWGVMAASGSGKGLWVKDQLRRLKPARLVIWDPKDEYDEHAPAIVRNVEDVRRAMLKAPRGPLRIRYRCKPGTDDKQRMREFSALCTLVQAWGNCCFIAEELSQVTTPGWAPPAWRDMTTGGRHENVHIIGIAQNPALIDKTFLSNCTLVHVGPLREARHRQAVARSMDVQLERITALVQFQWIERDHNTRELREGWSYPPGMKVGKGKALHPRDPMNVAAVPGTAPTPRVPRAKATGAPDSGRPTARGRAIAPVQTPGGVPDQPSRS